MGSSQYFCPIHRTWFKKVFRRIRFQVCEYVPDSGQEHMADGDDGFLVPATCFYATVTFRKYRMFFGFDQSICILYQN